MKNFNWQELVNEIFTFIIQLVQDLNGSGTNEELGKKAVKTIRDKYDELAKIYNFPGYASWLIYIVIPILVNFVVGRLHITGEMPKNPYTMKAIPTGN